MPCVPIKIGDSVGFACGPGLKRAKPCACGSRLPADLLCDWKVGDGTCDAPICRSCATHVGHDRDLCPDHARAWAVHPKNPNLKPQDRTA